MKFRNHLAFPILFLFAASSVALFNANRSLDRDQEAVEAAVLDYVDALYEADTSKVYRSVHPDLMKRGFYFNPKEKAYSDYNPMTFEQLVQLSVRWNKDGDRADENSPKKIEVFEVLDKTASAKLTAEWGIDYFHLAKLDGKWYIMNVLWQSPPREDR